MENENKALSAEEILAKHRTPAAMNGCNNMDYWKIDAMKEYALQQSWKDSEERMELKREVERLNKPKKWKYCPECGSPEIVNENLVKQGFRECKDCGQEWWTDVDYSETLQKVIKNLHSKIAVEKQKSERLLKALKRISTMHTDSGVPGCTYGDTEYDSMSAAYGYNLAVSNAKDIVAPLLTAHEGTNKEG